MVHAGVVYGCSCLKMKGQSVVHEDIEIHTLRSHIVIIHCDIGGAFSIQRRDSEKLAVNCEHLGCGLENDIIFYNFYMGLLFQQF